MTERKLNIGMLHTGILIALKIYFAISSLFYASFISVNTTSELINTIAYAYLQVSVLVLIKNIVSESNTIGKYLRWIIGFEIIKTICSVLASYGIPQLGIVNSICGLSLLVLYIILVVNILNNKYDSSPRVSGLRPYAVALIISFVLTITVGVIAQFNGIDQLFTIINIVSTIPFVLLLIYFQKMKHETTFT